MEQLKKFHDDNDNEGTQMRGVAASTPLKIETPGPTRFHSGTARSLFITSKSCHNSADRTDNSSVERHIVNLFSRKE